MRVSSEKTFHLHVWASPMSTLEAEFLAHTARLRAQDMLDVFVEMFEMLVEIFEVFVDIAVALPLIVSDEVHPLPFTVSSCVDTCVSDARVSVMVGSERV